MEALQEVPDPRKARGQRYPWTFLLTVVCAALASGQRTPHAIAHWITLHATELRQELAPRRNTMPSEATVRRLLRRIDLQALEKQVTTYNQQLATEAPAGTITTTKGAVLRGQAVDGKELRGLRAHGQPLSLVHLVQHGSGTVLGQTEVSEKSNEITAVPALLAGRDLSNTVLTMDALLTQRELSQHILEQRGHYLMVVKENQPALYQAIALLFEQPPWLPREKATEYQVHRTTEKGHGRRETRVLESSTTLSAYLDWPGIRQVLRRQCKRVMVKTGEVSTKMTYGITSLPASDVGVAGLEVLWRGHWTVENCTHYVLDVTMGEDGCQVHVGQAPQALSVLRKAVLALLRAQGWTNIADGLRYYGASVRRALELIGALPT